MPIIEEHFGAVTSFSNLYSWLGDGVDEHIQLNIANYRSADFAGSIAGWIKLTDAGTHTIFSSSDTATDSFFIIFGITSGKIRILTVVGGASDIVNATTTNANTGSWVHVAVTSSGTAWKLYVNGTLQGLSVIAGTNSGEWFGDVANRDNIVFGRLERLNPAGAFPGKLANFGIYNAELTGPQVTEVMNLKMGDLRTSSVGGNLVGAWYFPGGQADYPTYTDYSGAGNDMTMINGENTDINVDVPV